MSQRKDIGDDDGDEASAGALSLQWKLDDGAESEGGGDVDVIEMMMAAVLAAVRLASSCEWMLTTYGHRKGMLW